MGREAGRGADADGGPPPRPPPSPPATGSKAESLRDRVSFAPSSRTRTRPSCWAGIRIRRVRRSRSGAGGGEQDAAPAVRTVSTSRVCGGSRGCSGCGGRADATAGARSLLQRNDFYCDDCNTHRQLSVFPTRPTASSQYLGRPLSYNMIFLCN
ncbi:hypothetical protein PAHAL_5G406500 [Panicum hallii]|uniref:Uncharacterized protein n=1 Tax=Panicum hallii TaxID=206008 RepID=A0A2S3HW33_9POAL|nr:hypothetical protein PAHAL_5G406500 [Panicum hallii]